MQENSDPLELSNSSLKREIDRSKNIFKVAARMVKQHSEMLSKDEAAIDFLARSKYQENKDIRDALFLVSKNKKGNNLLHLAKMYHCWKLFDYLIEKGFPLWRKNNDGQTVYEIRCLYVENCEQCKKARSELPKKVKKIRRQSIIAGNKNLDLEFILAKDNPLEQNDLEDLIYDLIEANKFNEAFELVKLNNQTLDLTKSLKKAISRWIQYPKNSYIEELIGLILVNSANIDLPEDMMLKFDKYPDLKSRFNRLVKARNDRNKPRKSSFYSKIFFAGSLSCLVGFILYKMLNDKGSNVELKKNLGNFLVDNR